MVLSTNRKRWQLLPVARCNQHQCPQKRSFYCKSCRIEILNCINEQCCCNRCHKERKCARTTQVQRGNYYLETWVEYMMLKILLKILLDFFIENGVKIGMD